MYLPFGSFVTVVTPGRSRVARIRNVVDGIVPGQEVLRSLVNEFLAVERISLIRVIDGDLTPYHIKKGSQIAGMPLSGMAAPPHATYDTNSQE